MQSGKADIFKKILENKQRDFLHKRVRSLASLIGLSFI